MTKLLFLGFDGMDFDLLNEYLEETPSSFFNRTEGSLLLMIPEDEDLNTGPCWTTIFTGLSKNHHGILKSWGNPQKFKNFMHPCIWDILNENDLSVGLFGLPVTYPPKAIRKFWVSGFPTPAMKTQSNEDGAIISFPASIQEKYLSEHLVDIIQVGQWDGETAEDWGMPSPGGKIDIRWQNKIHDRMRYNEHYIYDLCDMVYANQLSTIKRLFTDMPVDIPLIQFSFIDHVAHLLPIHPLVRKFLKDKVYSRIDRIIEDLWCFFKPENLVIVSDHGFKGDEFYLKPGTDDYYNQHSKEAVAFFHGPNIVENYTAQISNMDLLPTLLFMLDIPPPKTDGKTHYGLFKSQHFSEKDQEEIDRRLRILGYIE